MRQNVKYIFSENLLKESCKNPAVKNRARLVHNLIKSYELTEKLELLTPKKSSYSDLRKFHSKDYVIQLQKYQKPLNSKKMNRTAQLAYISESSSGDDDDCNDDENVAEEFGLGFDCPTWPTLYDYCLRIAGSTITAAEEILRESKFVINFFGGWHHARRDKAAGFCYINDVVLGILTLRQKYDRILYLDLDIHHGDGVQGAFETTKRVLTLSFHQFESGFYPGSGDLLDVGFGNGKGYSINCPYKSGICGENYQKYFFRIIEKVFSAYQPKVIVVVFGADAICGDPLGGTNLTPNDFEPIFKYILEKDLPILLLGGGGYNFPNTSRFWTILTALILDIKLQNDVPDENEDFLEYSPSYELNIERKKIKDLNDWDYLEECCKVIEGNIERYNVSAV